MALGQNKVEYYDDFVIPGSGTKGGTVLMLTVQDRLTQDGTVPLQYLPSLSMQ